MLPSLLWKMSKREGSRVSPGFWSSTLWMIELFTKMAVGFGVQVGMGEINSSKSVGFLVVKSIILLDFWMGLC